MIISRTPFRISLFGGGSDYPAWFRIHGGSVFGFAINKYCYISLRELPPFFEHKHRIVYSQIEMVNDIEEISHPSVRGVLNQLDIKKGLEIHHDGDLPARSGLGSSSSFTVGLIHALYALDGKMVTKRKLTHDSIHIEQNVIREHVGSQDQVWASYGGINHIKFYKNNDFSVDPLIMNEEKKLLLRNSLMLFFTGVSRVAAEIAGKKIENLNNRKKHIFRMTAMVDEAVQLMGENHLNLRDLGGLLHETWLLKRELACGVTNNILDEAYQVARSAGALGGKVLGAGGGGFMVFLVEKENQVAVADKLKNWLRVKIDFDMEGSKIVVYEPQGLENS